MGNEDKIKQADIKKKESAVQVTDTPKMIAMETLANGIAHDFNNILSGIVGYSEVAMLHAKNDEQISNLLEKILETCDQAKSLINQVLSFSRQDYTPQDEEPLEVEPIISKVMKHLKASLPENIEIKESINKNTGLILASPTLIYQVIMHLCTNAIQAMKENGGILTINLSTIVIDFDSFPSNKHLAPGHYLKLIVGDNGPGIATENIEKIFDPYFTTKAKGEGTGLGLSVVHGVVKNYKGAVTVNSEANVKTAFEILLPLMILP